jgi:ribosomal protein L37AE/L43A
MRNPETGRDDDVQQCPSCESPVIHQVSVIGAKVWFVCGRCHLRWHIGERRAALASEYRGFERRRPLIG